jgi:O-antigen/teichoic acid export membrane protein
VLVLKVAGAFGGFLFSLLVARKFGDDALGRAELFVLAITVGATLLRLGAEGAVVKLFSGWSSTGQHGRIARRFRSWSRPICAVALAVACLGVLAPMDLFLVHLDGWLGWAIGAWVLIGWSGEALRGTGRVGWYALLQPGWWMLLAGIFVVLLGLHPVPALSVTGGVLAVLGMVGAMSLFARQAGKETPELQEGARTDSQTLMQLAGPIWLGSMLHLVLSWADTALIAAWMETSDVAHYRAAFRLAALLTFTQFAVNALGAPTFGALHAKGDAEALRRAVHRIGWMNTAVALPGLLFLVALGTWLLGFWGPAFAQPHVYRALLILAAGQCFNALCGPVMYLLNMTGGERAGLSILAISAVAQLSAAAFLVPEMGLIGAAWSAALGMLFWNALGVFYIRRQHGFVMISLLNGWWKQS